MARIQTTGARLMVLVDGENFPAKHAEALVDQSHELGAIVEVRVYGHYDEQTMRPWQAAANRLGLTQVNVAVRGPNSCDFRLTIETVDMLHARNLDGFCIASSDSGFSALAERIRAGAVRVYGFGEKKAKPAYRSQFDAFFEMTATKKTAGARPAPAAKKSVPKAANPTTKLLPIAEMLAKIEKLKGIDGWTHLAEFGKHYRPKIYGYTSITKLVNEGLKGRVEINSAASNKIRVRS